MPSALLTALLRNGMEFASDGARVQSLARRAQQCECRILH